MIDLSNEALDALEAQPESVGMLAFHLRNMADGSVDAIDAERLSRAATLVSVITALRAREAAIVAAAFEVLCNVLHCCDTEAQAIANRISGPRGERNRCPDGVQVLEDAETIIRAAAALVTPADATAALEAIKRAERNKARREAADPELILSAINDAHDMDVTTRDYANAVCRAIIALIEPEDGQ